MLFFSGCYSSTPSSYSNASRFPLRFKTLRKSDSEASPSSWNVKRDPLVSEACWNELKSAA